MRKLVFAFAALLCAAVPSAPASASCYTSPCAPYVHRPAWNPCCNTGPVYWVQQVAQPCCYVRPAYIAPCCTPYHRSYAPTHYRPYYAPYYRPYRHWYRPAFYRPVLRPYYRPYHHMRPYYHRVRPVHHVNRHPMHRPAMHRPAMHRPAMHRPAMHRPIKRL